MIEGLINKWFDVNFLVVDDHTMRYDLLLGRQFFQNSNLKLIYQNGRYNFEINKESEEFIHTIFNIDIVEKRNKYDNILENLDQDMPYVAKEQLLDTFKKIDNMEIKTIEDNYCAKVYLKDESFFRYAPRRMSINEKKELDAIIDNLLDRKIIKPSISPYCARVILVPKKNGEKRMYVDLRPLNQRIYPQKYPFPIIDDQLDKLYGKNYFTKLDLKDGFHQIPIHADYTKYFSFATHSGQYEYLKLPFGFSEAPAEFQKRILDIFKDLIREGKILIYIDDLLIATVFKRKLRNITSSVNNHEKIQFRTEYIQMLISETRDRISWLSDIIGRHHIMQKTCTGDNRLSTTEKH